MAVNEPSLRAKPEVCLCCRKSMATRAITISALGGQTLLSVRERVWYTAIERLVVTP